jgi:hypothetical protein
MTTHYVAAVRPRPAQNLAMVMSKHASVPESDVDADGAALHSLIFRCTF